MYSAIDIVSSIFRKNKDKDLEPQFIRDENKFLCKAIGIPEFGDPGRTCRTLYEKGFLQKNNSLYSYNPEKISTSLVTEFEKHIYVYEQLKDIKYFSVLQIPLNQLPTGNEYISNLADILQNYKLQKGSYGVHYFGLQYAKFILDNGLSVAEIVKRSGIGDNYNVEVNKGIGIYKIASSEGLCDTIPINNGDYKSFKNSTKMNNTFPIQTIYYGVPGSGKSNKIDEATKSLPDEQKIRVVFHPEYTNADFVGQILPVQTSEGIEYPFKAGPFSRILKRALKNPAKSYYLIIEEINRGNAAAIFGDLFQLLDRGSDGWSSYSIENLDINAFIRSEDERYSEKTPPASKQVGGIVYTENTSLRLPPNLSLYATMNTSDQNVFTLDNAFQRRWDMQLVENQFDDKDENATAQRNAKIGGSDVTWEKFQTHINRKIGELSSSLGMSSMEDKRLGCWFVKAENSSKKDEQGKDIFIITKKVFADKVLKYLWDDAFKFSREEIFDIKDKTASLEAIVSAFKSTDETKPCNWKIFKNINFTLKDGTVQSGSDAGETE